jgi:DNA anti-recombination protein RmuC
MIVSPMSLFPMLQITVKALHNMKVEDSINDIIKNVEKLSNHLNAYKTYHDKLGNTLGTAVNHYNDTTKEFKKINKDIIKISGSTDLDINTDLIEKPSED